LFHTDGSPRKNEFPVTQSSRCDKFEFPFGIADKPYYSSIDGTNESLTLKICIASIDPLASSYGY